MSPTVYTIDEQALSTVEGPAGKAYQLLAPSTLTNLRRVWMVRLREYHPVLEWFAAILHIEDWDHVFSIAPLDPELYIEEGLGEVVYANLRFIDADTLAFPLRGFSAPEAEALAEGLIEALVRGIIVPDKFEQGSWNKEIDRLRGSSGEERQHR